jgi:hypothetical protein
MNNHQEQDAVLGVALLLIAVLCLGFSFVTMMYGYRDLVGSLFGSAVLSLIMILMLFALNYRLRKGLQSGMTSGQIAGLLAIYMLVVFASFSGLFNRFYSTFMQDELIKEELQQKITLVQDVQNRAKAELINVEAERMRGRIEGKVTQLQQQIQNPGEPGLGPKALGLLKEIEADLNNPVTLLKWNDNSPEGLKRLSNTYSTMIRDIMEKSEGMRKMNEPERRAYAASMTAEATRTIEKLTANSKAASNKTEASRTQALGAIQEAVNSYKAIGSKTRSLLKGNEKEFVYDEDIRVENDELGKISHTYRSAGQHITHWSVWMAAFLALMIDLVVPLFVYFLTPRGQANGRNFSHKNAGHGVIHWDNNNYSSRG